MPGGKNSKHIYFVYFYSKSEIEPLFKNADPDGDGHVSLEDGAKILAQKFPLMPPEALQRISVR